MTGAAVAVSQHTTTKDIVVSISGGTFSGVKQLAIVNPQKNKTNCTKDVKVIVGSGVSMTSDKIVGTKTGNSFGIDGTYYLDSASALAAGVNAVASIDNVNYASLEDAIDAATSGEIVLKDNVKISSAITLKKGITLNLNEKTLSFADGQNLVIQPDTPNGENSIKVVIKNGSIDQCC